MSINWTPVFGGKRTCMDRAEIEQTITTYEPDLLFTELDCSGDKQTLYEYNEIQIRY